MRELASKVAKIRPVCEKLALDLIGNVRKGHAIVGISMDNTAEANYAAFRVV